MIMNQPPQLRSFWLKKLTVTATSMWFFCCLFVLWLHIDAYSLHWRSTVLRKKVSSTRSYMSTTPQRYVPIPIAIPKTKKKSTLLVKRDEMEVINALNSMSNDGQTITEDQIDTWTAEGLAFRSTPEGVRAMHIAETKQTQKIVPSMRKPSSLRFSGADLYIQAGTDQQPLYIKASKAGTLPDLANGVLSTHQLEQNGDAFTNVTELFETERVTWRAADIAERIKDFPIMSSQYRTWVNKTDTYNASSLQQVMAAYYQDNSIGDVGGPNAKYESKRGYPGTLGPGENFKEDFPIESLPCRVLHPWPSMQEMQFHVRWPPAHPMLPPPLLFFGLNNMYTDNFTNWQLSLPYNETVGGLQMEPKDAMRIAKYSKIGLCYNPDDQLKHGGLIFPGRHCIPNYNPDHGPTISEEEIDSFITSIPRQLKPFTQRWVDPYFNLEELHIKAPILDMVLAAEAAEEEEARRIASERVLLEVVKPEWLPIEEADAAELEREVQARLATWMTGQTKRWAEMEEEYGVSAAIDGEDEEATQRREQMISSEELKIRSDMIKERNVKDVVAGKARSPRALISYTIDVIRDMNAEIARAERDMGTRRKSGRRRQRKGKALPVVAAPPSSDDFSTASSKSSSIAEE